MSPQGVLDMQTGMRKRDLQARARTWSGNVVAALLGSASSHPVAVGLAWPSASGSEDPLYRIPTASGSIRPTRRACSASRTSSVRRRCTLG